MQPPSADIVDEQVIFLFQHDAIHSAFDTEYSEHNRLVYFL
ncbi:hypothetical protein PCIT_a0745 [Pseudoalteromonas citrea]|uniref:Uncharacterized protein n=1 Tax=Pseudoalteromonas citrea TaxID=43655 RepID=A0AAD4AL51_9GAMM|nr:hypothetical protein PCIT_a0745 [Pseudoalteromonas citrea]